MEIFTIIDCLIVELNEYALDTWAHTLIKRNNLTKKQYYNMAIIIRQSLDLARKKGILISNPFNNFKIDYKLFQPVERVTSPSLNKGIRRYCNKVGISEKGMHKIRKTYISTLIDAEDININYIREQVGHTDERTTYGNYCFNRKSKNLTAQSMEKALTRC